MGFEVEFANSLSKRFSHEFQFDRHVTVSSLEKLSEKEKFSDIFINLQKEADIDIFTLAKKCQNALVEGGTALVELNFIGFWEVEHPERNLEKLAQEKFSAFNLYLERLYLHENLVSISLVLRKRSIKSV